MINIWTPVTQSLPEHENLVLVCYERKDRPGKCRLASGYYIHQYGRFQLTGGCDMDEEITFWMELPDPPARLKYYKND